MASYLGKSGEHWREVILLKLRDRNRKECQCFKGLIAANNKLFDIANTYKYENLQLTIQNERFRMAMDDHCKESSGNGKPTGFDMKVYRLQEEITNLHRSKAEYAQQVIDLRNVLTDKERDCTIKESNLRESELNLKMTRETQKNLELSIQELEATNQLLKDEYQALQLAYSGIQDKLRQTQEDNRELVDRWMREKARDADQLNEENEIFIRRPHMLPASTGISKKCIKLLHLLNPNKRESKKKMQKVLDEAAKDPTTVDIVGQNSTIVMENILNFSLPTRVLTKLDAHEGEVLSVKWGPRGKIFATGGADRKVKLWELFKDSVELKGVLRGSNAAITSLDFNSEEDLVLGTSNDMASRVWTASDQRLRHTLTGHSGRVLAAKFLGDSTKVVSGSHDRTIKMWDLRNLACIRTIFTGSSCNDVVTDRPGTMLISAHFDKRIRLWDMRRESTAHDIVLQGKVTSLDLSPDGHYLLSCVRDNTLKLLDLRMNQVFATFCAEGFWVAFDYTRAVFTPDGRYVSVGSQDGTIFIWNADDNSKITTLKEHNATVVACSWQPTGSTLLSCDKNKQVVAWTP